MNLVAHPYKGDNFYVRRHTHDANIFNCVVKFNEYNIPAQLPPNTVVVDIGAHIGSFSYLVMKAGASKVFAYEAHPQNHAVAKKNLEQFGKKASIDNLAVWRCDDIGENKLFNEDLTARTDMNTGGLSVLWNESGIPVATIPLDAIIVAATENGTDHHRVNILKIDCEGSEYPILMTCNCLDLVDSICGEYHEIEDVPKRALVDGWNPPYNRFTLKTFLEQKGFRVQIKHSGENLGLFFADRP